MNDDSEKAGKDDRIVEHFSPPVWVMARGSMTNDSPNLIPVNSTHDINSVNSTDWKYNEELDINKYSASLL